MRAIAAVRSGLDKIQKIWAHSDARTQHPDLFFCCMIGSPDRSDIAIHHDVGSDSSAS